MDGLSLNHGLFETLREEHRFIKERLNGFTKNPLLLESLKWVWDFVELHHHRKEEILLFKTLALFPKLSEGGPMCTLYFDLHLQNNPLKKCLDLTGQKPETERHQNDFFSSSSPLRIPVEEHQSGKAILNFLQTQWDHLKPDRRSLLFNEYRDLQQHHMEKEENCLFHICTRLLSPNTADNLLNCWNSMTE